MILDSPKKVHFIGIGGIGMSAIALMMKKRGHAVQGSDKGCDHNKNIERLKSFDIAVFEGHEAKNVGDADVVVKSSAIPSDNPEWVEALAKGLPVFTRAQMLAMFMQQRKCITVAGTNGKTTTTSLIGHLLDVAGFDPTIVTGGVMSAYGSNIRLGDGEWMVVESDESDGSFLDLPSDVSIITNIQKEHLDHYNGSFEVQKKAYQTFASRAKSLLIVCNECDTLQTIDLASIEHVVRYGFHTPASVRAENIHLSDDMLSQKFDVVEENGEKFSAALPLFGSHNILNALSAVATLRHLGVKDTSVIQKGLESFPGVDRRFTLTGEGNGVYVYDDYGHHPASISSVLSAARKLAKGKIIAVFQPHRFTRLRDLFTEFASCFSQADQVVLLDVYAANEAPIDGVDSSRLRAQIPQPSLHLKEGEDLSHLLFKNSRPGDFVIFFGASNIMSKHAREMPSLLQKHACQSTEPTSA